MIARTFMVFRGAITLISCLWAVIAILMASCSLTQKSDPDYGGEKYYKLRLDPANNSSYQYTISNKNAVSFELEGQESEQFNHTTADMHYDITRDSAGQLGLTTVYHTISVVTDIGGEKTEVKVSAETVPFLPMEKMLKVLRDATVFTTLSPSGEVLKMEGVDSMEQKLLTLFADHAPAVQQQIRSQWRTVAKESIVKKNLDQVFRLFPDSAVRLGDTWKITSRDEGPISVNLANTFTLRTLNDDIALVSSEGSLRSNNEPAFVTGLQQAKVDMTGVQKGQYEMEAATGMLITAKINVKMKGTIEVMGRNVPMSVTTDVVISGKRIK